MKKLVTSFTLVLVATLTMGCSTRKLEAGPQVSAELMMSILDYILGNEAAGFSEGVDVIADIKENDTASTIFFAQNDNSRPVVSVLSLNDLGWIDGNFSGQTIFDMGAQYVYTFLIDGLDSDGNRRFGIALLLEGYDGGVVKFTSVSDVDDYKLTDDAFEFAVRGANGERVILKSQDVSPDFSGELGTAVKLEVWVDGYYSGQISAMSAYGGLQ